MAITNYLVHFLTEDTYNSKKSELRNDAVAFVKDATIIHTHGIDYYCGAEPVALKSELANYATQSWVEDKGYLTSVGGITFDDITFNNTGTNNQYLAGDGNFHSISWYDLADTPYIPSQYTLVPATYYELGGIKIGYSSTGKNYAVQLDHDSNAYVTVNWTDTHYTANLYVGNSTSSSNTATTNGDTHLILVENSQSRDRINITGTGLTTVSSNSSGDITINGAIPSLNDLGITASVSDINQLQGRDLDNYLSLDGGVMNGIIQIEKIQSLDAGSNTLTLEGGQNTLSLAQAGLQYNNSNVLTEDNWESYITVDTDAANKAGATNQSSLKLFLVGASNQAAGEFTYSNEAVYQQAGELYASRMNAASGFYETSDATLKNFKDDIKALEIISKIPTKYFTWKKDELDEKLDPELHIGTSAQEIQKLYPDLVIADENGILSVDYARLSIIALAAIKELKAEINKLQN